MMVKSRKVRWVAYLVLIAATINIKLIIVAKIRRGTPKCR
jgi:hypothetical protein